MQIVHFLKTLQCAADITTSILMGYLCKSLDKHTSHISKMYTILTSKPEKLFYMMKWGQDIAETFETRGIVQNVTVSSKSYINTSLIKANYKVLLRWYIVSGKNSCVCPRGHVLLFWRVWFEGTVLHIWWSCPKVKSFWIHLYNFIFLLTQVK